MFEAFVESCKKLCEVLRIKSTDKSVAKVFAPPKNKLGREIPVTFVHPEGGPKSFTVCLPPGSLKGPPGKIPSNIFRTPIPEHPFGVVALKVVLDKNAPKEDRIKGARWFCVFEDGSQLPARIGTK